MTDPTPAVERVAAITERLSVLLGAGVTPSAAWRYLADADAGGDARENAGAGVTGGAGVTTGAEALPGPNADPAQSKAGARRQAGSRRHPGARRHPPPRARLGHQDPAHVVVAAAALAARDGIDVPAAIVRAANDGPDGHAWRAVAAAWSVAIGTGARLAPCLAQLARSQRALGQAQRDIDAALAGPRSTAKFVTLLPAVGLLFGTLLGFDTLGILFTTAPGLVCLALGITLTILAWRWSNRMVTRALPVTSAPGLEIDLLAIALSSGTSLPRAQAAVENALEQCRLDQIHHPSKAVSRRGGERRRPSRAAPVRPRDAALGTTQSGRVDNAARTASSSAIDGILALSRAAGIPAADLLTSEAARIRRDARSEAQRSAAALGTRLMIPLGLCILPAFMLVGVVPLVLSVLSSTVSGFG